MGFTIFFLLFIAFFLGPTGWAATQDPRPDSERAKRLQQMLRKADLITPDVGILVRSLKNQHDLFEQHSHTPLNPASNLKIVSTVVALKELGVEYQFRTRFYTDQHLAGGGIHHLYVVGGGDPYLVIERLWRIAGDMRSLGINEITGNLILDHSFFDDELYAPGWEGPRGSEAYFAPLAAFSVNFNAVQIHVLPGEKIGSPARVTVNPPIDHFTVRNQTLTSSRGTKKSISIDRMPNGETEIVQISGQMPLGGSPVMRYRNVTNPSVFAGQSLQYVLAQQGIRIGGKMISGSLPKNAILIFEETSPPLAELIRQVNKRSNNFMTEQLVKTLAAEKDHPPGSTRKGVAIIEKYLRDLGIEKSEFRLVNGSGLSRENRISARAIVRVLEDVYATPSIRAEFFSSLALGGIDGTLEDRKLNVKSNGSSVRAKTGSVKMVSTLSGYIHHANGDTYAFSLLMNNLKDDHTAIHRVQDQLIQELME